jgi:SAM-dependent methyltransferase
LAVPERLDAPAGEHAPQPDSAWWGVHAARYGFGAERVAGHRVLDIASGTGYGMRILSSTARTVVGVDLDFVAARSARDAGPVVVAKGTALPFRTSAFDAVTSFETIEHLEERAPFLAELTRVLVPRGGLVLSTPNAWYTRPVNGRPRNPFHVFEYTPEELDLEIRRYFGDVEMLGQAISRRFRISPFWDDQQRLSRTPTTQARLMLWRVLNRLPARARDTVSRAVWGHPLYPGAKDYTFTTEAVTTAPVLVVTARSSRTA